MKITNNDKRIQKQIVVNKTTNLAAHHENGDVIVIENFVTKQELEPFLKLARPSATEVPGKIKKSKGDPANVIVSLGGDGQTIATARMIRERVLSFVLNHFDYPFDYDLNENNGQLWRFTETTFENMHYDLFFHPDQMYIRCFINLSDTPRFWRTSYNLNQTPIDLKDSLSPVDLLTKATFNDLYGKNVPGDQNVSQGVEFPFVEMMFEPGDMWFAHSQLVSHQVIFGNKMVSFSIPVKKEWMKDPKMCMSELFKTLTGREA